MCMQCVATGVTYAGVPLGTLYARALLRTRRKRDGGLGGRSRPAAPETPKRPTRRAAG